MLQFWLPPDRVQRFLSSTLSKIVACLPEFIIYHKYEAFWAFTQKREVFRFLCHQYPRPMWVVKGGNIRSHAIYEWEKEESFRHRNLHERETKGGSSNHSLYEWKREGSFKKDGICERETKGSFRADVYIGGKRPSNSNTFKKRIENECARHLLRFEEASRNASWRRKLWTC